MLLHTTSLLSLETVILTLHASLHVDVSPEWPKSKDVASLRKPGAEKFKSGHDRCLDEWIAAGRSHRDEIYFNADRE